MRRVRHDRAPCDCGAYHYPHRRGSGACRRPELAYTSPEGLAAQAELAELRARWRSGERSPEIVARGRKLAGQFAGRKP